MPNQLSFREFDAKLKSGRLTASEYETYVEIDPEAVTIRLRFKPGALKEGPPPGYEVDQEVYYAARAKQERALATRAAKGRKRVLAEGDSWFNLPPVIRPQAIADRMQSNGTYHVKNIARWGHTLEEMLVKREYLEAIATFRPDCFIFSGGGNDLQEALARGDLVLPYDPHRPIGQIVSPAGRLVLLRISEGYRQLLNELSVKHPLLKSLYFAYDYPKPEVGGGKYIGQYLRKLHYPAHTLTPAVKVLIDELTTAIESVVSAFPLAQFLDCRTLTASHPFYDDMHPDKTGFQALTAAFEHALSPASTAKTRKRKRPRKSTQAKSR